MLTLERSPRAVYSSSPDRGGDIVLEVWPQVRERVPDAELLLSYSRWFDRCAEMFQQAADQLARIRKLLDQPGVTRVEGGLGQRDLAHLMKASMVWCAPSYYTPGGAKFCETSCISAMEAQAAGLVVVASNWGALTETVAHGTLIDGDPAEKDGAWRKAFVDAVVEGLTNEDVQHAAQTIGPEMMRGMDWRGAAEPLAGWIWEACGSKGAR
jgi:glycosyltransferase involved in cell wall biosynthesis